MVSVINVDETMNDRSVHIPVLFREVDKFLSLSEGAVFVDCTLGLGGHAGMLASRIGPSGVIIGIDRDEESLSLARENLSLYPGEVHFVHDDFRNIDNILQRLHIPEVDGMLFDLGISSYQLNNPERGFSFQSDGPLDMRMDKDSYISAYDLVNSLSREEIATIIKKYGEERYHRRIAERIVSKRPIQSTKELNDCILQAIPKRERWQKIHPATRTFQAFRIAVNRELESIEIGLEKGMGYLKKGACMCVISFHSLEDRIVKNIFRNYAKEKIVECVIKKPLQASEEEIRSNVRSRSAKLRVARRL